MVEGPGCKLKGLKIKAKIKGQKVIAVDGNAVVRVSFHRLCFLVHIINRSYIKTSEF